MAAQRKAAGLRSPRWRIGLAIVAVVVVASVSVRVLRARSSATVASLGGPSAAVEAGGLQMTIQVPPGPYFLSELLEVQMTLANRSQATYQVQGPTKATGCGSAVWALESGGGPPTYRWPMRPVISCVPGMSTLAPGQTYVIQELIPVGASGRVTLSAEATFYAASVDPKTHSTPELYPFAHGWPTLNIQVAPQVPTGHTISLTAANGHLTISAPQGARDHLYYVYIVRCGQPNPGASEASTNEYWQPVISTLFTEPACSGRNEVWQYSVAAPGYAIASGEIGAH